MNEYLVRTLGGDAYTKANAFVITKDGLMFVKFLSDEDKNEQNRQVEQVGFVPANQLVYVCKVVDDDGPSVQA